MEYAVFVTIPTLYKVEANSEEAAKKKITDALLAQGIIKPADYFKVEVAEEVKIEEKKNADN